MIFFTTILPLLIILLWKVNVSSETENIKQCELLQQHNVTKIALVSVMNLNVSSPSLLLITTNQLVYELSLAQQYLDTSLNLSKSTPVSLKQKWPSLKRHIPQSSSLNRWLSLVDDKGSQWLLLGGRPQENGFNFTLFSVQTRQVESRLFALRRKADAVRLASGRWLSSPEASHFYVLDHATLSLAKVAVHIQANSIQLEGEWLQLCKHSDTFRGAELLVLLPERDANSSSAQCHYPLKWALPSSTSVSGGFTDGKWFAVLANQSVYLFDAVAVSRPGTVVAVTRLTYSQFITCSKPDSEGITPLHKLFSLVAICLIFVIVIGMAFFHVYLLQYDAFQATPPLMEKEPQTKPTKKTSNTSGSINGVVDGADCKECKEIIETRKVLMSQKQNL